LPRTNDGDVDPQLQIVNSLSSIDMTLIPWKTISRSIQFKNPWWSYGRDAVMLPSGKEGEYHYVHSLGSACVIPVADDGTVLLVNQFRYLGGRESIEFPCGAVKEGATHDQTAWHELAEETGFSAISLACVGEFNPYNGVTDEMCRVYLARDLRSVNATPDDTEQFELLRLTPEQITEKISSGEIWDGMSIAAWCLVREKKLL
jgi:ADP-ribose pyrophosphatase